SAPPELCTLSLHDALPIFEAHADLLDIATQGSQQGRLAPVDTGQQNQPVEGVVLRLAVPDRSEGTAEQLIDILDIQLGVQRIARSEEHTSELQSRENLVCR